MSSPQEFNSGHNPVNELVNYLRKDTPFEEVSTTTPSVAVESSRLINNKITKIKKEKKHVNLLNEKSNGDLTTIERLPTGRVRYGPLVVNPRKKPSKTIFTGRHSKDEKLEGEAEVKRRLRRDRNRLAATKYREAREKVLSNLEEELRHNQTTNDELTLYVERLLQRKQQLEFSVSQIMTNHPEPVQNSSEIVHPITSSQTFELVAQDQEQFQMFLTNSSDAGNSNDFHLNYQLQQQEQQQQMTINSSSLNRLLDECVPPINTNNNNNLLLFNSAYGTSTCAQQYSSSSSNEDDSMLSTKRNSYVC